MQRRDPKLGVIGVLIALVAMSVSLSVQAASKATATCQCQEVTAMATLLTPPPTTCHWGRA